jgi:hypothetical protein
MTTLIIIPVQCISSLGFPFFFFRFLLLSGDVSGIVLVVYVGFVGLLILCFAPAFSFIVIFRSVITLGLCNISHKAFRRRLSMVGCMCPQNGVLALDRLGGGTTG